MDSELSIEDGDVVVEDDKYHYNQIPNLEDNICYIEYEDYIKKKGMEKDESLKHEHIEKEINMDKSPIKSEHETKEILPKKIIFNILQDCEVVNVINPNDFYILRLVDHPCLTEMLSIIDAKSKLADECSNPEVGNIYLGRFTNDDNWYRAKILNDDNNGKYHVHYIDYSNEEEIDITRLRECPQELKDIPEFAVRCCLQDTASIGENGWSEEAIEVFKKMAMEHGGTQIMAYTTEKRDSSYFCHVELRKSLTAANVNNESPFSLRKALTFMGFARVRGKNYINEETSMKLSTYDRTYSMPNIRVHAVITAKPGKVHTPWSFYLYSESDMKMYEVESNSLQEYCRQSNIFDDIDWMIFYPIKGMVCIVISDDKWHRAIVKQIIGKGFVDVLFVDSGFERRVSYTELRKLPDSFSRTPVQAMKCSLADICPLGIKQEEEWTADAIQYFTNWLHDNMHQLKANVCRRKEGLFEVDLTVFNGKKTIDIAHLLVEKNYAISVSDKFAPQIAGYLDLDPNEDKGYASMNKTSRIVTDRCVIIKPPVKEPSHRRSFTNADSNKRVEIKFLGLKSPDCIFVQFVSQNVFSRDIERLLTQEWSRLQKPVVSDVTIGGIFGVEYKKNNYARVKVLQMEDKQCMTELIDIGGLKAYCVDQLYLLTGDLLKTKGFAAIVKLANIIPPCGVKTWPNTAVDMLNEVLKEKEEPFIIKCGSAYRDPKIYNLKVLPVQLGWVEVTCEGAFDPVIYKYPHVNELLINSGLALPLRHGSANATTESQEGSISEVSSVEPADVKAGKSDYVSSLFSAPDKPVRSWPPAEPLTETRYQAVITNVDNDCNIYFHLAEHDNILKQIGFTYEYKYTGTQQTNNDLCWGISSPVVAQYHGDDNWYRAVAKGINKDSIHVHFVDYGNNDDVCVTNIRAAEELYMKTPILCYQGKLAGIIPLDGGWIVKQLDFIHHVIVEQRVIITLVEPYEPNTTLKMDIELMNTKQDVARFLVDIGNICQYETPQQNGRSQASITETDSLDDGNTGESIETSEQSRQASLITAEDAFSCEQLLSEITEEQVFVEESLTKTQFIDFILPKLKFPTNQTESFAVEVTWILNARTAFIIPYADEELENPFTNELKDIRSKFNDIMNSICENIYQCDQVMVPDYLQNIYLNQHKDEWKRICVLADMGAELIKIRYLDYGQEAIVRRRDIKKIPQPAYSIPPLAIPIYFIDSESQALRSLFYQNTHDSIMKMLKSLESKIYATVMETRQVPKMKLFIVKNARRINLFEYLTK